MRHAVPRIRAERPLEQAAAPHNVVVYLGEVLSGGRLHAVPLSKCLTNIMMYLTRAKRCLTMSLCMQARRSQKVLTEAGGTCSNPARSTRASRPSCSISHAPCGASHPCWKACRTCCVASQSRRVPRRGTVRRCASSGAAKKCLTSKVLYLLRAMRCLTMSPCMQARRSQHASEAFAEGTDRSRGYLQQPRSLHKSLATKLQYLSCAMRCLASVLECLPNVLQCLRNSSCT